MTEQPVATLAMFRAWATRPTCGDMIDSFPCARCGARVPVDCPDYLSNRPALQPKDPA